MKKAIYLLLIVLLFASTGRALAQCTPNPNQHAFLVPDTTTNFALAYTYMAYLQVLYVAVPTDTMSIHIDSLVFVNITGLPASITSSVFPANGLCPGGSKACIRFSGTPVLSEIGIHNLTINAKFYGTYSGIPLQQPVALNGYRIHVLDSSNFGIPQHEPDYSFKLYQNTPNPFNYVTEITYSSSGNENISFQVFNIIGTKLFDKKTVSVRGDNSIYFNAAEYNPGIYFYRISNGKTTFTRRMIVTNH